MSLFVHWNNREWTVNSELQLDSDGLIVSQTVKGITPFGAPIDEGVHHRQWRG